MKLVALVFALAVAACGSNDICSSDHCVCTAQDTCVHDCTQGGLDCHVECGGAQTCDVGCVPGENCHVECNQGKSCDVDCGGANDCHVACPPSGCTVKRCEGDCIVTCGLTTPATRNGTTATCP
jgi:hypothetical protein